jgi:Mg/Co/Ni transporter MgtE
MNTNKGIKTENEINLKTTDYVLYRMLVGALIGFVLSFVLGYFFFCYRDGISVIVGFRIFRNPFIGMGLIGISFFGTILGALSSMFSKKWQRDN